MTLDELIAFLEEVDPSLIVLHGFAHPHSYRGRYEKLAFVPTTDVTAASMLACAKSAVGATYDGWKGGEFTMDPDTDVYLAEVGGTGEELSRRLLTLMVNEASISVGRETSL